MGTRTIDVHYRLVPAISRHPQVWQLLRVAVTEPSSVLNFATGYLRISREEVADASAGVEGDADQYPHPVAVWDQLSLQPRPSEGWLGPQPGVILLGAGGFVPGDEGILIREPVRLFAGQNLVGIGPAEEGSVPLLDEAGPAIEVPLDDADGERVRGDRASVEGVLVRPFDANSGAELGIRIRGARRCRVTRVRLEGVRVGVRFENGVHDCRVEWSVVRAFSTALAFDGTANRCHALGCHFTGIEPVHPSGDAPVVDLSGTSCELLRCRIESPLPPDGGGDGRPEGPLVQIEGTDNAIVGCRLVGRVAGPMIQIGRPGDGSTTGTLLERNVYGARHGVDEVDPNELPPVLVEDNGLRTRYRDVAASGFPPLPVSVFNWLANGSFEDDLAGAERLPDEEPLDAAAEVPELPEAWKTFPREDDWGNRANFEAEAPPARFSRYAGLGWAPARMEVPQTPAADAAPVTWEDYWFEGARPVHHGERALWLGVPAGAKGQRAVVRQVVELPNVAREFVLSAFVKGRGAGEVFIGLNGLAGGEQQTSAYHGDGDWQQRTITYTPPWPPAGPVEVEVQCGVAAGPDGPTEALFDRMLLVAGNTVPHYSSGFIAEDGGVWRTQVRLWVGRTVEARLDGTFQPKWPYGVGAAALQVLGTRMELRDDVMVLLPRRCAELVADGHLLVDVRRGGVSISESKGWVSPTLRKLTSEDAVCAIPLARVDLRHRQMEVGDLLSLHVNAPGPVESIQVVLTGVNRVL